MRIFSLVSLFYLLFFSTIGGYIIYLPKVLDLLGYSSLEIGITFSMSPLMRFLTPFLFLRSLSLTSKLYRSALLLSLGAALLFPLTIQQFWLFLIPNILLGISFALTLPYVETIALERIGRERYGRARLFGSLGFIGVALLLAHFMEGYGATLILLISTIVATVVVGWYLGEIEVERGRREGEVVEMVKDLPLWLNFLLMQISFGPFYNFFTIYESQHGLDYTTISYLWTFGVVAEIVMLYLQGALLRRNLLTLLKLCSAITAFRWFLVHLYPTHLPLLFFAQSLHAFSFALYYSAAISYLFLIYSKKTLAQQLFGGISFGLGGMVGSSLAGLFYGEYLFLYAAVVAVLATFVLFFQRGSNNF
ncbi:MAG: MFS transporter [Epsilonproteobacteria bacterium]|nr:MFS transporter [Campylobacterota bacterium]NPA56738.1 MFS transporter [Campylobacterota bacterium]